MSEKISLDSSEKSYLLEQKVISSFRTAVLYLNYLSLLGK